LPRSFVELRPRDFREVIRLGCKENANVLILKDTGQYVGLQNTKSMANKIIAVILPWPLKRFIMERWRKKFTHLLELDYLGSIQKN
jgi:hypothetical protein